MFLQVWLLGGQCCVRTSLYTGPNYRAFVVIGLNLPNPVSLSQRFTVGQSRRCAKVLIMFLQDISHSVRLLTIDIVLARHFPFCEQDISHSVRLLTIDIVLAGHFPFCEQDISHSVRLLTIDIVLAGHFPFHETSDK